MNPTIHSHLLKHEYTNLNSNKVDQNFVAVKIGDVDGNVDAGALQAQ